MLAPPRSAQVAEVEARHAAALHGADLAVADVEQRHSLEAFAAKPGIVGQRQAEVASAHDRHAQLAIKPQNLTQMALQILDVVPNPTHAELAEIREILTDLRGIEV